jgi:pyruvate dehydrogenase E1 component alpha subunit
MTLPPESGSIKSELYRKMMRIRMIEVALAELYKEQEMMTPTHFSIGQEAVAVGVCAALSQGDPVYSGHRCHAHYLAKGGPLDGLVAELYGRETGSSRGRGGSVHLTEIEVGFMASTAILGETIAVAVGAALAFNMDSEQRVATCFFGDGAIDEGIFQESLNYAAVRKLPVIFVCENNLYSTHTKMDVRQPVDTVIAERAEIFSILSVSADGYDAMGVYETAREARKACLEGRGPVFLEFATYRWREHVGPYEDYDIGYRTEEEVNVWKKRDPIKRLAGELVADGECSKEQLAAWSEEVRVEIERSVERAQASPFPDPATLMDNV